MAHVNIVQDMGYSLSDIQIALDKFAEPCHSVAQLLDVLYQMEDEEGLGIVMHEETEDSAELEGAVGGDIRQRSTLHPLPEPADQASQYQASLPEVNYRLMHHQNGPRGTSQNISGEEQANHIMHGTPPGDKQAKKVVVRAQVDCTHTDAKRVPSFEVPKLSNSERHLESYQDYLERLNSFSRWPKSDTVTPDQLAKAGFYYTGTADRVQCAYCNNAVDFWLPTDCPLLKHKLGCIILRDAQRREEMSGIDRKEEILNTLGHTEQEIRPAVNFLQEHNMVMNTRNVLEVIFAQEDGKKPEELLDQLKGEDNNLSNTNQILTELGFKKDMVKRTVTIAEEGNLTGIHNALNILLGMESERDLHEQRDQEREERIQTLQQQADGHKEELMCKVCLIARICVLFLPCRHLVTCETCGKRFRGKRCPLCREFVSILHYPVYF